MKLSYLYRSLFCVVLVFGLSFNLAQAQMHKPKGKKNKKSIYPGKNATTSGSVTIEGKTTVNYKAVAGTIPLFNNDRDTTAHIFFVAYFKKGVKDLTQRPVTFLYNGGPGSATVWLHMGSFGPVRVNAEDTVHVSGAPYELVNNDYSLLDVTDLVFIDAPGTGFSRLTDKADPDNFFGVYQDASAFGNFIYGFLKKYDRWNSPKYLFGESYGTTRNAVLSSILTNRKSIDLNGVIMLSQILNFDLSIDGPKRNPGNYLPFVLGLPTYAATAWYHHKLPSRPANLESFIQEVEKFARGPYTNALAMGSELSDAQFNQVAEKLHQYTGLSVKYIKKANLRVDGGEFEHQLLLSDHRVTGRLDTRFRGPVMNPLGEGSRYDPQSANISSAYISLFNHYVRSTLHFGKHMTYRPSYRGHGWSFKYRGRPLRNVMPFLARAMIHNPKMKVMLNTGYYDLATPFFEGIYELQHLPMPKSLQKNISIHLYQSGHMVYVKPAGLKNLRDNVAAFIKATDNVND